MLKFINSLNRISRNIKKLSAILSRLTESTIVPNKLPKKKPINKKTKKERKFVFSFINFFIIKLKNWFNLE